MIVYVYGGEGEFGTAIVSLTMLAEVEAKPVLTLGTMRIHFLGIQDHEVTDEEHTAYKAVYRRLVE